MTTPVLALGIRRLATRFGVSPSIERGSAGWWAGRLALAAAVVGGFGLLGIEASSILA